MICNFRTLRSIGTHDIRQLVQSFKLVNIEINHSCLGVFYYNNIPTYEILKMEINMIRSHLIHKLLEDAVSLDTQTPMKLKSVH